MNTKVSVIIPVYNVEKYLRECLDSVCTQTYRNLEIICVDDGSTDNSPSILREYAAKDSRIVLITKENAGQGSARNAALRASTGEWIFAIDSDDYIEIDAIETLLKHIDTDVDVVCGQCFKFQTDNLASKQVRAACFVGKFVPNAKVVSKSHSEFCMKLWRKLHLERYHITFPEGIQFEDLPVVRTGLSMARHIVYTPEALYAYRQRPGSSWQTHVAKQGGRKVLDYLFIADYCISFWRKHDISNKMGIEEAIALEMEMMNYISRCLFLFSADEYLHDAWIGIRNLIDKYDLGIHLPKFPELALHYHLPPYAFAQLQKQVLRNVPNQSVVTDKALHKDMLLLANEKRIYWQYRRVQLLGHLTWGKKRRKYKEKKRHYHELIRRCRQLRKELLHNI